jgi:hypothetical protein
MRNGSRQGNPSGSDFWPGRRLAAVAAALGVLLVAGASAQQTKEREMFVSVLTQADVPVLTLGAADFVVREDGRTREVLRARQASDPIDIALLIDTSQALDRHLSDTRKAVEGFIDKMSGRAHISLIGLGDRPTILTPYSDDKEQLKKGLGSVFPITGAGAYVLDSIQETMTGMAKRTSERSAIVVVFLGGVEFSNASSAAILDSLQASSAALHVITVGNTVPRDAMSMEGRNRETVFDRGTAQSGGRRENVLSSMNLPDALAKLAGELLGQYRITYARPDTLIPPKKVEVSVRQTGLTVRATPVPAPKPPAKDAAK